MFMVDGGANRNIIPTAPASGAGGISSEKLTTADNTQVDSKRHDLIFDLGNFTYKSIGNELPGVTQRILSESDLLDKGFDVIKLGKTKQWFLVTPEGEKLSLTRRNGVFYVQCSWRGARCSAAQAPEQGDKILDNENHLMHRRFMHMNNFPNLIGPGMSKTPIKTCDDCISGKGTRKPHTQTPPRPEKRGEVFHCDLIEVRKPLAICGSRWALVTVDGKSGEPYVIGVRTKADVSNAFKLFKGGVFYHARKIRSDGGSEFVNDKFRDAIHPAALETTTRYSPERNGIAERMMRELGQACRCNLHSGNKPLWLFCMQAFAHVKRLVYGIRMGLRKKEELKKLRVFGCKARYRIEPTPKKLDPRYGHGTLVGYHNTDGYKVLDDATRRVFATNDVYFDESVRPIAGNHAPNLEIILPPEPPIPAPAPLKTQQEPTHTIDDSTAETQPPQDPGQTETQPSPGAHSHQAETPPPSPTSPEIPPPASQSPLQRLTKVVSPSIFNPENRCIGNRHKRSAPHVTYRNVRTEQLEDQGVPSGAAGSQISREWKENKAQLLATGEILATPNSVQQAPAQMSPAPASGPLIYDLATPHSSSAESPAGSNTGESSKPPSVTTSDIFRSLTKEERAELGYSDSESEEEDPCNANNPFAGDPARSLDLDAAEQEMDAALGASTDAALANFIVGKVCVTTVSEKEAFCDPELSTAFEEGEKGEQENFLRNDVYDEVPESTIPRGKTPIRMKLVWQIKCRKMRKVKVRSVFMGNFVKRTAARRKKTSSAQNEEEIDDDDADSFSPVIAQEHARFLKFWACQKKKAIQPLDVDAAYLKTDMKGGLYYAIPPKRWQKYTARGERMVWRLKKWVYGLTQSGRAWHAKCTAALIQMGFVQSAVDGGVFYRCIDGEFEIFLLYVDDGCVIAADQERARHIAQEFLDAVGGGTIPDMKTDPDGWQSYKYVGLGVRYNRERGILTLNQNDHIDKLVKRFGAKPCKTPCNALTQRGPKSTLPKSKRRPASRIKNPDVAPSFREGVGALGFISASTRPDVSWSHTELSRHLEEENPPWDQLLRTIGYLGRTADRALVFQRKTSGGAHEETDWQEHLEGYSDADWGGTIDSKSTTGYIVTFNGTPFVWKSGTQRTIATSTAESETVALCSLTKSISCVQNLIADIFGEPSFGIPVKIDNRSALEINSGFYTKQRSRHYDLQYHYCRQKLILGNIDLQHVTTDLQRADGLTKPSSERVLLMLFGSADHERRNGTDVSHAGQ
jgi:hypothetical protein